MSAPAVEVIDWQAVRREAEEVHRLIRTLPLDSPRVPALLVRGEQLVKIGNEYQRLEAATCCGWVH